MTAPERIWAKSDRGFDGIAGTWLDESDGPDMRPYILATPKALADSTEGQDLIAEARREGESLAKTIWLTAIETVDDALREMGKHADPRLTAIDALKRRAIKKGE